MRLFLSIVASLAGLAGHLSAVAAIPNVELVQTLRGISQYRLKSNV